MIVNSPVFGEVEYPTDDVCAMARILVDLYPIAFFQAINKKLNERGLCILVDALGGEVPA